MPEYDVVILGCGWAGIAAAYSILNKRANLSIVCIDKSNKLGGLLRSETINGFTFDIGGSHIIFSKDKGVLAELLSLLGHNVIEHKRKAYVLLDGLLIPYPFENGIHILSPELRSAILISFLEAYFERLKNENWIPRNFEEWIYKTFGKEIAKLYLIPYNEKYGNEDLVI